MRLIESAIVKVCFQSHVNMKSVIYLKWCSMVEVSIGILKFLFWHWSFGLNDFFSYRIMNKWWMLFNECMSDWQVLRGAPHVHMRNKIYYHPLKLYLQKQPLGVVLWKSCSILQGLPSCCGNKLICSRRKGIFTGYCFSLPGHQG